MRLYLKSSFKGSYKFSFIHLLKNEHKKRQPMGCLYKKTLMINKGNLKQFCHQR